MGFKNYLSESLLIEAKVKAAGREFPSKEAAGLFLAKQGKTADQIVNMIGTTLPVAKWYVSQADKDSSKEVDKKTVPQTDSDSKTYKGYTIKKVRTPVASTSPNARMFGRSGIKHVSEYNVNGFKRNFESMTDAKAAIDKAASKTSELKDAQKSPIVKTENKPGNSFDRTKHQKELQRQIDIITKRLNDAHKHGLNELEKYEKQWPEAMKTMYDAGAFPAIDGHTLLWERPNKFSSYPNLNVWEDNLERPEIKYAMGRIEDALKNGDSKFVKLSNTIKSEDDPNNVTLKRFLQRLNT